jgi:hypothetical protein
MSSSASKENARRCRVHFFFPDFGGLFSEITAPARFLLLLAQKKNKKIAAMAATTIGTATAALSAGEQERLLHEDFSETVTGPSVALLAALVAVLVASLFRLCVPVSETPGVEDTEVAKVVGDVGVEAALPETPALSVGEPVAGVVVAEVPVLNRPPPVVCSNSLDMDERMSSRLAVLNVWEAPVKPAPSGILNVGSGENVGVNDWVNGSVNEREGEIDGRSRRARRGPSR